MESTQPEKRGLQGWLIPRRLRAWREYVTAYLMIAPATLLIFMFGIFPVGFALYVSLHKWRLKRGDIIGLTNYTNAIGPLAYLMVFALGLGLLFWAFSQFRRIYKEFEGHSLRFWLLHLPGILLAGVGLSFVNWTVVLLPNILDIADKIRGVEKTRELFFQLLNEAFTMDSVLMARGIMLWSIIGAIIAMTVALYLWRSPENLQRQFELGSNWFLIGVGVVSLRYVYTIMLLC